MAFSTAKKVLACTSLACAAWGGSPVVSPFAAAWAADSDVGSRSPPTTTVPNIQDEFAIPKVPYYSIANNQTPVLPLLNDAQPIFGLPGTVAGPDISKRTQLTGDWGGARTKMTQDGVFIDLYSTSAYQNVYGGLRSNSAFVQTFHGAANIDTARAGGWEGGLVHFAAQARFGAPTLHEAAGGSGTPSWTAYTNPAVYSNGVLATDYLYIQSIRPDFTVYLGKANSVYLPDQSMFGSSGKTDWSTFNFSGANPLLLNAYGNVTWVMVGDWAITDSLSLLGGALDPNSKATNFATNAFNGVNLYAQVAYSYKVGDLPGQIMPIFNWSSKRLLDLSKPIKEMPALLGAFATQAPSSSKESKTTSSQAQTDNPNLGDILAFGQTNYKRSSWMVLGNYAQYFYVYDDPETVDKKLKTGQLVRGFGVQGRLGYGAPSTNFINRHFSVGLYGAGVLESRPYDRFGAGFYFNGLSPGFKDNFAKAMRRGAPDEKGMEVFYNFALTPAVGLISSYQYIWNPIYANILNNRRYSSVFLERLSIVW